MSNVTPIRPPDGQSPAATPPPDATADDLSTRNFNVSLKVAHVHATLDLLHALALRKDEPLDNLCANTLDNALYGVMLEIESIHEYVDRQPCNAAGLVSAALRETERLYQCAEKGNDDESRYSEALEDLKSALDHLRTPAKVATQD